MAVAPVDSTIVSASTVSPLESVSTNGRLDKSAWTITSDTTRVPACSAWAFIWSISSGPRMPLAKPGKFSTSCVEYSWPIGRRPASAKLPSYTTGLRLARAA